MKKAIVLLLALAVLGGAVFAQATVNGYVRGVETFSDTGATFATRARLNLSYTTDDKNGYAYIRLQSSDYTAPAVSYAYARVTLLDGMVKLTGGKLANYDYDISSGISDYASGGNVANDGVFLDAAKAMLLQIYPIEGLNIGVAGFAGNGSISDYYVAAKYDLSGLGAFVVESSLATELADSRASVAFQFTGVEGLTASAGYKYNADVGYKMASLSEDTVFGLIDYTMGDVTFEIAPEYRLTAGKLYIEGYVNYVMGNVTLNVLGAYDAAESADTIAAKYFFGAEAYYNVGKGQIMGGFYYDDVAKWSIPLVVKVSF